MENPFFSVIIPCYNSDSVVIRCLESVVNQSYPQFEVWIVDDGSTDQSTDVIQQWIEREGETLRFNLVRKDNGGPASARNVGIRHAKGTYVAFLDVDDEWQPNKLETVKHAIDLMDEPPAMVSHHVWIRGETNERYLRCGLHATFEGFLEFGNTLITSATIVKKDSLTAVGCFDESRGMIGTEDYDLWLALLRDTSGVLMVDEALTYYHVEASSLSQNYEKMIENHMHVVKKHLELCSLQEPLKRKLERASLRFTLQKIGRRLHINGEFNQARYYYLKALSMKPICPKLWILSLANIFGLKLRQRKEVSG